MVIAGILLLGAWLFFVRSTFSSMGTVGVVLLLALFAAIVWWMVTRGWLSTADKSTMAWVVLTLPRPAARHRHVVGAHPRAHLGPGLRRPRRPVARCAGTRKESDEQRRTAGETATRRSRRT